jgi:glycosyltransferase involved in cell wall biosynthesis
MQAKLSHPFYEYSQVSKKEIFESLEFVFSGKTHLSDATLDSINQQTLKNWTISDQNSDLNNEKNVYEIVLYEDLLLAPDFLETIGSAALVSNADLIYSDYYLDSGDSLRHVKLPTWSPIRLSQSDYLGPVLAVKRSSNLAYSLFPINIQDARNVARIPFPTYSVTLDKEYVCEQRFLGTTFSEISEPAIPTNNLSIVIPTKGTMKVESSKTFIECCIESIKNSKLPNTEFEIVIVFDVDSDTDYLQAIQIYSTTKMKIVLVPYDQPFNFSKKCNIGAQNSTGETLIFLNDDTRIITTGALEKLASISKIEFVGAVGALATYPSGEIQHAGISFNDIKPNHAYRKQKLSSGFLNELECVVEVTAVTGACIAISKEKLSKVNGWTEDFNNSYNDVDFCMKLVDIGLSILQDNTVKMEHSEAMSRDETFSLTEFELLKSRWQKFLGNEMFLRSPEAAPAPVKCQTSKSPLSRVRTLIKDRKLLSTLKQLPVNYSARMKKALTVEPHQFL